MRAVTLHAFGVTVYGYNDNMKKQQQRYDKKTKNIQIQKG